ncbi:MAG: beta-lactamase family protein [Flammeovirgaceae bacterium]|nr:MAG: beta-lactamase family protein [Flammeovirgaceae bacterium]
MKNTVFILLLLFWSCTGRSVYSDLDAYFSSFFNPDEPGAAVLILKSGQPVFSKSYGLADLHSKEPITSKTLFNLGSISKTFVAYGILILRDQGKLSLDDPVSNHFTDFKNKSIADKVTIRHLLTHTSGLPDNRNVRADTVFYLTAKDEENWAPVMQADALNFEPGERFEYSNPAFNGLALIIEKVSGMKWQKFIEENIFKPSGMTTGTITDGPHPASGVSHGYVKIGSEWKEDDYGEEPTFAAAGNGGVWSSIDELVLYEKAIREGRFLSKETITESQTIQHPANWKDEVPHFIGLSWFVEQTDDGLKTIGHTGTQGGFYCHYVYVPEKDILYLVLANREIDREAFQHHIFNYLEEKNWLD